MGNNQDKKWILSNQLISLIYGKVELFEIAIELNTNLVQTFCCSAMQYLNSVGADYCGVHPLQLLILCIPDLLMKRLLGKFK